MWRGPLGLRTPREAAQCLPLVGTWPKASVRLRGESYVGFRRYFLTLCTAERKLWFADESVVAFARSLLLQTAVDNTFALDAYCFMPDHLHILAEGLEQPADLCRFVSIFKQRTGI
jgi:putative transposase